MNRILCMLAWLAVQASAYSTGIPSKDLIATPPPCRTSPGKRPFLKAEQDLKFRKVAKLDWHDSLTADFNGDGWCDFALKVPYPINSQMDYYFLDGIFMLGGPHGWRHPRWGVKRTALASDDKDAPKQNVDLTGVSLVYLDSVPVPYVLGLKSGYDLGSTLIGRGCFEYSSVYRWDDKVDAFRRVEEAIRERVIALYYAKLGERCGQTKK